MLATPSAARRASSSGARGPSPTIVGAHVEAAPAGARAIASKSSDRPLPWSRRPTNRISGAPVELVRSAGGAKTLGIDAAADDVDVRPALAARVSRISWLRPKSLIATAKRACASLAASAYRVDVVELDRAVDGEAPRALDSVDALPAPVVRDEHRDVGRAVGELRVDVRDPRAAAMAQEDHRLGEVEEMPEALARAGRARAQRERQRRQVAARRARRAPRCGRSRARRSRSAAR